MGFLITGFGRSGTKFLSEVMNRSKTFTVLHEPRGESDLIMKVNQKVKDAFQQENYGEVNSYLREDMHKVGANKVGVIYREPKEIITSIANRNDLERSIELVKELNVMYHTFDCMLILGGITLIQFNLMTTDKGYLGRVLNAFSITDVDLDEVNLGKKINANPQIFYKDFDHLPTEIIQEYYKLDWNFDKFKNYG